MKRLLWIGDAGVPSGFARVTHAVLDVLREKYEIVVLGINYRGDPHDYPYPIYAAAVGGDSYGVGRLHWMCHNFKPDVIVLQQDGWNVQAYVEQLRKKTPNGEYQFPDHARIPVVASLAVDGKNFQRMWLNGVASTVFWTQFALNEAREAGHIGSSEVIPLGVDLEVYHPIDKHEARRRRGLPISFQDAFIVGTVNRNQSRKRWDLTIRYFAEWVKGYKIKDAYLYMHAAPTGEAGCWPEQLMQYYGVLDHLVLVEPPAWYGLDEEAVVETYNCFDVQISTTQGEGFGLTTLEGMACGVPQIVPDWAGLGDWAKAGAWLVPCTSTVVGPPFVNVIGGIPDERAFVMALNRLYVDERGRKQNATAALECAQRSVFRWEVIGEAWLDVIAKTFEANPVEVMV